MKVLIVTFGSTGDIFPMLRLGVELRRRGHEVDFGCPEAFHQDADSSGLKPFACPPGASQAELSAAMREMSRRPSPLATLERIYHLLAESFDPILDTVQPRAAGADLLVTTYLFPFFRTLARDHGIPFATIALCHNTVPSDRRAPSPLPTLPTGFGPLARAWHRGLWRAADRTVARVIRRTLGAASRRRGIDLEDSFILDPADLACVAVSPGLFGFGDPAPPYRFTGTLCWQAPRDPELEVQLQHFLGAQPAPVLNFGSVTFDGAEDALDRLARHWPRGRKLIVQSGWAQLKPPADRKEFFLVGKVSHDQLFRHASLVIHHGGAGTTASVLHSGIPHIIIPHIADQPFWASEIVRLGLGRRLSPSNWISRLAETVAIVESDQNLRRRADECAAIVAPETGPATTVRLLEDLVQRAD